MQELNATKGGGRTLITSKANLSLPPFKNEEKRSLYPPNLWGQDGNLYTLKT